MRSKIHKQTVNRFLDIILEQYDYIGKDYLNIFIDTCITDISSLTQHCETNKKLTQEIFEQFIEKIDLIIILLKRLDHSNIQQYETIIVNDNLRGFLIALINTEHPSICIKAVKALNLMCEYYVDYCRDKDYRQVISKWEEEEFIDSVEAISNVRILLS
jgi:hypothetical protein